MYRTLGEFVHALADAGELSRVSAKVSPVLEISEIADRVSKSPAPHLPSAGARRTDPRFHHLGGKALLFENVAGSDMPVLINAFGSYQRMEMALGCNDAEPGQAAGHTPGGFEALAAKIGSLVKPQPPASLREIAAKARELLPLLKMPPKRRRGMGGCQEVVITGDGLDLTRLPLVRCWPLDGDFASVGYPAGINDGIPGVEHGPDWDAHFRGRYITLGGIHTIHADDREHPRPPSHNIGMYRVQLLGTRTMAMHWHLHHDGARHWRSWKARGEPMPVAIALGGESVLPYAATAPLPPGISELLLAGFLNRGGIEMVRARTVPLWVPANAEIVIEGFVSHEAGEIGWDPRTPGMPPLGPGAVFEGPFGDHTGFYSMPDRYPILTVTAITHRRDPIYPTTIVGLPPQEDYYLGKATERLFLPLLKTLIHDVEDYDLPMFGAFHNAAFVKIKKAYPLQGRRVMHSVWGAGQMAWTKSVFVVDDEVDVHDTHAVLAAAAERCEPSRDIERVNGPLDILDHAAPRLGVGMKAGFDCTRKMPDENLDGEARPPRAVPRSAADGAASIAVARGVPGVRDAACPAALAHGWLFVSIDRERAGQGRTAGRAVGEALAALRGAPAFVIVVGGGVNVHDIDTALFHWAANSDASRDWQQIGPVLCVDATPKCTDDGSARAPVRAWPPLIEMNEVIRQRVRGRWGEYGIESPQSAAQRTE